MFCIFQWCGWQSQHWWVSIQSWQTQEIYVIHWWESKRRAISQNQQTLTISESAIYWHCHRTLGMVSTLIYLSLFSLCVWSFYVYGNISRSLISHSVFYYPGFYFMVCHRILFKVVFPWRTKRIFCATLPLANKL